MITPILLCGGSGTRLWPLSRKSYPKQFSNVLGEQSLFQASANRFVGPEFSAPIIVTGNDFRFIVTEQLDEIGVTPAGILIEPSARNTAPAAILATLFAEKTFGSTSVLLVPADHVVPDADAFKNAVAQGAAAEQDGQIVTFGIAPTRAETGYGWLEAGPDISAGVQVLNKFIEKPDSARAEALFEEKNCMWNSGLFLAGTETLITAFEAHAADILKTVQAAFDARHQDLNFIRFPADLWDKVPDESVDYAIMEKAEKMAVVRFDGHWSDLGSWEAVWQESDQDSDGNAVSAKTTALQCKNSLLRSESEEIELVGIGLENIAAVAMRDAVLVANISDSQHVKTAVAELKQRKVTQAETFPVDHRPWGWFETLTLADRFQVKRIYVHPGASLSLQSHHHRAEHWIVVAGTARVTVDDEVKLVTENQSVYIPLGAVHRMENPGKLPMVLIEVQTGAYLGEDDIIRYEDKYERGQGAKG